MSSHTRLAPQTLAEYLDDSISLGYRRAALLALEEAARARMKWPRWVDCHHGYGVLTEEYRELETEVFKSQKTRDPQKMYDEAIQLAAMALTFAADLCNEEMVRK